LRLGASIRIGYSAQLLETIDRRKTPMDLVRAVKPLNEQQALGFLISFLFERDDTLRPTGELSGGELARLQIALLILSGANFLLLDEPTNNLDINSVEILEEALLEFGGTMLAISHDRYFLDKVCGRTITLSDGNLRDYPGGYTWTEEHAELGSALTRQAPKISTPDRRPGRR